MGVAYTMSQLGTLGMKRREINVVMARVMRVFPLGWIRDYLAIHFTKRGATKYGYTPRQGEPGSGYSFRGSYTQTKLKRHSHTRPLEFSGRGKNDALTRNRATSTSKSASAVLNARVFNFRNPNSKVDMRRELTTVTDDENQRLDLLSSQKAEAEFGRATRRAGRTQTIA